MQHKYITQINHTNDLKQLRILIYHTYHTYCLFCTTIYRLYTYNHTILHYVNYIYTTMSHHNTHIQTYISSAPPRNTYHTTIWHAHTTYHTILMIYTNKYNTPTTTHSIDMTIHHTKQPHTYSTQHWNTNIHSYTHTDTHNNNNIMMMIYTHIWNTQNIIFILVHMSHTQFSRTQKQQHDKPWYISQQQS